MKTTTLLALIAAALGAPSCGRLDPASLAAPGSDDDSDAETDTLTGADTATQTATDAPPMAFDIAPPPCEPEVECIVTLQYADPQARVADVCAVFDLAHLTLTTVCACEEGVCTAGVAGWDGYVGAASFRYSVAVSGVSSNEATASVRIEAPTVTRGRSSPGNR